MYMSLDHRPSPCSPAFMTNYHGPNIQPVVITILRDEEATLRVKHTSRNLAQTRGGLIRVSHPLAHLTATAGRPLGPPPLVTTTLVSAQENTPPLRRCATERCSAGDRCQAVFTPAQTQSMQQTLRLQGQTQPSLSCRSSRSRRYRWLHHINHRFPARRPLIDRPSKPAGLVEMTCFSSPSASP